MRRMITVLAVGAIVAVLSTGTALAVDRGGGGGDEVFYGTGGRDSLVGGTGDDVLYGYAGGDKLYGGTDNDWIHAGDGPDLVEGGTGRDVIYTADGRRDIIDCGTGFDWVRYDRFDVLDDCEAGF